MKFVENLKVLLTEIPEDVTLIVVTKQQEVEIIRQIYNYGYKIFGENKVQELIRKKECLPDDVRWHLIGHLQTNKIKFIAPFISMIHSVDSYKLLAEINKYANKNNRVIDCLLQFHIATEETKYGLYIEEVEEILTHPDIKNFQNVTIRGVMGMATFTDDLNVVRDEFTYLRNIYNTIKSKFFFNVPTFSEISMGMTNDYEIAIAEGSTIVRIGSKIFH